jgi:hypothetical protein
MAIKLVTNHQWRNLRTRDDVPAKVLASEFDWLKYDEDTGEGFDGFIYRRGTWHHLSEFTRLDSAPDDALRAYDGIRHYSFSSGVVIKLSPDGEQYKIAYYYVTSGAE